MSVHVFLHSDDIQRVDYRPSVAGWSPVLTVETNQGLVLYVDVEVMDRILDLGKADQARQDAAVQS